MMRREVAAENRDSGVGARASGECRGRCPDARIRTSVPYGRVGERR